MGFLFNIPDFVWTLINIVVLYLVLKKVLFKPVTEFMEKRTNSIKQQLDEAKNNTEKAQHLKETYDGMIGSARGNADSIIKDAVKEAQEKYDEIIRQARVDAENLREAAVQELEAEKAKVMRSVRDEVVSLALEAASKVVEANMDTEANRRLVDEVLAKKSIA